MNEESENKEQNNNEPQDNDAQKDIVSDIFNEEKKEHPTSSLFEKTAKPEEETPIKKDASFGSFEFKPKSLSEKHGRRKILPMGIDLGLNSIKIAQLALENDKAIVSKLVVKEFPTEFIEQPDLRDKELPELLKKTLEEFDLKGDAYSAIPTNIVNLQTVTLPQMPAHEIEGAVNWEMKRLEGEGVDDLTSDYVILDEDNVDAKDRIEVLTVSASKQKVLDHLELLESAGLKVQAVDSESLSLLAGVEYNQMLSKEDVALLIDLGGRSTRLNIISNNELHYSRVLNITGHMLTNAIKEYCRVSYEEAEDFKKLYGKKKHDYSATETTEGTDQSNAESDQILIKNAIMLLLEKLVTDIEHTFKYYSYQLTKSQIRGYNKVILSGGTANFGVLEYFLKERLGVDIEIYNPLDSFEVTEEAVKGVKNLKEDRLRFGVAIGLALRGIE